MAVEEIAIDAGSPELGIGIFEACEAVSDIDWKKINLEDIIIDKSDLPIKSLPKEVLDKILYEKEDNYEGVGPIEGYAGDVDAEDELGDFETLTDYFRTGIPQPRSGPLVSRMPFSDTNSFKKTMYEPSLPPEEQKLVDELEAGIIPDTVMEQHSIVDPEDDTAKAFQSKMEGITRNLFTGNYNAKRHDFKFLISDSEIPNACVITQAKPPIIIFSKGYLAYMDTEHKWAAALAHELTHQGIFDRIGAHRNSNPEESVADIWGVHLLQRGGYNPSAMLEVMEFLEEISEDKSRNRTILDRFEEVHPPYNVRCRNIENAMAIIEQREELNDSAMPADKELQAAVWQTRHISYLDHKLASVNYDQLPTDKKVLAICDLIKDGYLYINDKLYETRLRDLDKLVLELGNEAHDNLSLLQPLHDTLVSIGNSSKLDFYGFSDKLSPKVSVNLEANVLSCYSNLERAYGLEASGFKVGACGPLHDLDIAMRGFIDAETREQALEHALTINSVAAHYKMNSSHVCSNKVWPDFSVISIGGLDAAIKKDGHFEFSWNRHLQWSKNGEDGDKILRALRRFNIDDGRVGADKEQETIIPRQVDWWRQGYRPGNLSYDDQGKVVAHDIKRKQKIKKRFPTHATRAGLEKSERKILDSLDHEAKATLENVDWSPMEDDLWGFIESHRKLLTPQISVTDGGDIFIKSFLEKLSELKEKDPKKFGPLIHEFFTGFKPDDKHIYPSYDSGDYGKHGCSIPKLCGRFTSEQDIRRGMYDFTRPHRNPNFNNREMSSDTPRHYWIQLGLSENHPYIKSALQEFRDLFEDRDIAQLLAFARYKNKAAQTAEQLITADIFEAFSNIPTRGSHMESSSQSLPTVLP